MQKQCNMQMLNARMYNLHFRLQFFRFFRCFFFGVCFSGVFVCFLFVFSFKFVIKGYSFPHGCNSAYYFSLFFFVRSLDTLHDVEDLT